MKILSKIKPFVVVAVLVLKPLYGFLIINRVIEAGDLQEWMCT